MVCKPKIEKCGKSHTLNDLFPNLIGFNVDDLRILIELGAKNEVFHIVKIAINRLDQLARIEKVIENGNKTAPQNCFKE